MANIQIRDVPDDVHRRLKAQAAMEGQSQNEYLRRQLIQLASMPTWSEVAERIHRRGRVPDLPSSSDLIRQDRDSH